MGALVLSRSEVERALAGAGPAALLDALAAGFEALSAGRLTAPPRTGLAVGDTGQLFTMPGHVPGLDTAVKLVGIYPGNAGLGLPTHQAVVCLFDPETGVCRAVMDGTAITEARTAGAAALSVRLLARPGARVLAVVGAGAQAEAHLRALPAVRDFAEVRLAGRDPGRVAELAAAHRGVVVADGVEAAVRGADVVCLCTSAPEPVLEQAWLAPGAHVTSVGFAPPRGELPPALASCGRLFVEARTAFEPPPAGCAELQSLDPSAAAELGEVLLGRRDGRSGEEEITVYKSMGHVAEDLAAANLVAERARAAGLGREIDLLG